MLDLFRKNNMEVFLFFSYLLEYLKYNWDQTFDGVFNSPMKSS